MSPNSANGTLERKQQPSQCTLDQTLQDFHTYEGTEASPKASPHLSLPAAGVEEHPHHKQRQLSDTALTR